MHKQRFIDYESLYIFQGDQTKNDMVFLDRIKISNDRYR